MNSNEISLGKRIGIAVILLVGLVLIVRLGVTAFQSRRVGQAQTQEEFRATIQKMGEIEREQWEKNWRESGTPPPPGGFDAAWKRAMGSKPYGIPDNDPLATEQTQSD